MRRKLRVNGWRATQRHHSCGERMLMLGNGRQRGGAQYDDQQQRGGQRWQVPGTQVHCGPPAGLASWASPPLCWAALPSWEGADLLAVR